MPRAVGRDAELLLSAGRLKGAPSADRFPERKNEEEAREYLEMCGQIFKEQLGRWSSVSSALAGPV